MEKVKRHDTPIDPAEEKHKAGIQLLHGENKGKTNGAGVSGSKGKKGPFLCRLFFARIYIFLAGRIKKRCATHCTACPESKRNLKLLPLVFVRCSKRTHIAQQAKLGELLTCEKSDGECRKVSLTRFRARQIKGPKVRLKCSHT